MTVDVLLGIAIILSSSSTILLILKVNLLMKFRRMQIELNETNLAQLKLLKNMIEDNSKRLKIHLDLIDTSKTFMIDNFERIVKAIDDLNNKEQT